MSNAEEIIQHINNVTGIDVTAKSRKREITYCRIIYSEILRKTNYSTLKSIGKNIDVDHSMIIYYRKTFPKLMMYKDFQELYNKITKDLVINEKSKKEQLEELGWNNVNELLISDILKIYR
jgi:chromosomal replication initiation ATPase DnaA